MAAVATSLTIIPMRAATASAEESPVLTLTPRQRDIVRLMADGYATVDIARMLGLSPFTVKSYIERIYQRLSVYSRAGAVGLALRRGLL